MCRRCFCADCGEEMIHRDNRKATESASAFGQIMFREGPKEITFGDVDGYVYKRRPDGTLFRLIERFQADARMKPMQSVALSVLDRSIRHAARAGALLDGSGAYVIRGEIGADCEGHVDFIGPQYIDDLNGRRLLEPKTRMELWDWINGGPEWTRRDGKPK